MRQRPNDAEKAWHSQIIKPFQWLDLLLNWLERGILIVAIFVLAAVSVTNVLARNMGDSLTFADELAQVLLVVIAFVGLGHGVREGRHIRVSAVHDELPALARKVLLIIVSLSACILLTLLGFYAVDYIQKLSSSGRVLPSLQLPIYFAYAVVPIGFFMAATQFLLAAVRNLLSRDNYLSWHQRDEYELPDDAQDALDTKEVYSEEGRHL